MRKITAVLIWLLSLFTTQAQDLGRVLQQVSNGSRMDTLILFEGGKELEYVPLSIMKGKQPGPVVTMVAGIHGYEYPPIMAVQEMMKEIDVRQLHGTLIILPIANIASF